MPDDRVREVNDVRHLAVAMVALLLSIAPCSAETGSTDQMMKEGTSVEQGTQAPGSRFILTSHDGRTITDAEFRGRHMLVFFGYTHCPDVCPTSLMTVARVLELLGADADNVQPIFVTVDPVRDTRAVLAEFIPHFDRRIIGLTGHQDMIDRVAKGYRVKYAKVPGSGGDDGYTVDHTAALFHMGPDGEYIGRFPYETTAEDIAAKLRSSFKR